MRLLTALFALLAVTAGSAAAADPRPDVVVVMTDDQTYADLEAMPRTKRLLGAGGATFGRAYVSYPLCCPSRATFLTGQYAHNHGVRSTVPPEGGVEALEDDETLPVWLQRAGYETIHVGKYLNGYGLRRKPRVPPGWDQWYASVDKSTYQMYGYTLFENGTPVTYGDFWTEDPLLYQTDVLREKALSALRARRDPAAPFFMSLNFVAPHGEVEAPGLSTTPYVRPAPRHEGRLASRAFSVQGEDDVADKPAYVEGLAPLGRLALDRIAADRQARQESLLAVDEAIEAVVDELARTGRLENTYIVLTSDNGFFQGEHRIPKGKYLAYDPSTHVPLLVRGPGILPGTVSDELVSNADLAPTILQLTGAQATIEQDGRSLVPFARDGAARSARPILHEGLIGGSIDRDDATTRRRGAGVYYGVRTRRFLYVMWKGGERELYDLRRDPLQLQSRHGDPAYAQARAALSLAARQLRRCRGADCNVDLRVPARLSRRR